ncbi:MAG: hypothetical protein M1820_005777 [Bogoriella megaspora]|nr:MAG: hypothetical protein M1820_005777 [Bogoriella megaspora]
MAAAMVAPETSTPPSSAPQIPLHPIPLSSAQEQQVRELYYKRVRSKCADEIREFATCAKTQTYLSTIRCRAQHRAMNACMLTYATQDEQDAARAEWFATVEKRKTEREEKEAKRRESERKHREWWGLDEQGRRKLDEQGSGEETGGRV